MKTIDAAGIAARCNHAGAAHIRKSYIRNIKVFDHRQEKDWYMAETDYSFTHKGENYIVRASIVGDKRYSALRKFTVEKV